MKITMQLTVELATSTQTEQLGASLTTLIQPGCCVFLQGELGAGKTTLVRGLLHQLGHSGSVKSPTYTLVEPYNLKGIDIFHCDLYRLADPYELEYIGLTDLHNDNSMLVVEWPERGRGMLPTCNINIALNYCKQGRQAQITHLTPVGKSKWHEFQVELSRQNLVITA